MTSAKRLLLVASFGEEEETSLELAWCKLVLDFRGGKMGLGDNLGFMEEGKGAEGEVREVVEVVMEVAVTADWLVDTLVVTAGIGRAIDVDDDDDEDELFVIAHEDDTDELALLIWVTGGEEDVWGLSTGGWLFWDSSLWFCKPSSSEALVLLFFALSSASVGKKRKEVIISLVSFVKKHGYFDKQRMTDREYYNVCFFIKLFTIMESLFDFILC